MQQKEKWQKRMLNFQKILTESISNDFFSIDVQPSAENYLGYSISNYVDFINQNIDNYRNFVFFYNGPDLGFESESEIVLWLLENGLEEDVLHSIIFYDKGYAYFRSCMDQGYDEDDIVKIVKYMYQNDINDSRDFEEEDYKNLENILSDFDSLMDFLESGDAIFIPELMIYIDRNYDNIILTGGHRNACLSEVEIVLKALGKKYRILEEFVYD